VVHAVAQNLNRYYFDSGRARSVSAEVLKKEESGEYDSLADGEAFAARLTSDLRSATQDPHLEIAYTGIPLPNAAGEPTVAALAEYRSAMLRLNCTFEKIAVLPENIGYLKLNSFPDPAICSSIAKAALTRLNGTDAIIFDLRDNMGGYPGMVEEIAAPLFDHPAPWYDPKEPSGAAPFIHSPVPGSRLANKPAYILISSRTFSGAEQFAYNLKMLKRATLIGETTGGDAHVGVFHRLDDHFGIGIPETPITNPYGGPDWEGTGVHPDVVVPANDALVTAEELARKSLRK
jgi:C-terminal processing protease CtpA/Prc